jgi:CheY-like chemotaxis protein
MIMGIDILLLDEECIPAGEGRAIAEQHGIEIRTATTWREFNDWLRDNTPAAILMNVVIPGLPTDRATEVLRMNARTRMTPLIFVSDLPCGSPLHRSAEAFADAWVQKPLTSDKLLKALTTVKVIVEPVSIAASAEGDVEVSVADSRSAPRFVADPPIPGSFGAIGMRIVDLAERGAQIEHDEPLKLAASGRLMIASSFPLELRARVVWSKLLSLPGRPTYRSGLVIEEKQEVVSRALKVLVRDGKAKMDALSLDRKKRSARERELRRAARAGKKTAQPPSLSPDDILLVRQARERLRLNAEEATRWYNRARYSTASGETNDLDERAPYRDEVVAVWEYLDRSMILPAVARVFALKE